jgi:hypothetical protein
VNAASQIADDADEDDLPDLEHIVIGAVDADTYEEHRARKEIFVGVPTQNSESQRNPGASPAFRILRRDKGKWPDQALDHRSGCPRSR